MGCEFIFVVECVVRTLRVADFEVGEVVHLAHFEIGKEQIDSFTEKRHANFATLLILWITQQKEKRTRRSMLNSLPSPRAELNVRMPDLLVTRHCL